MVVLMKIMYRTQKLQIGLVAMAHIGDRIHELCSPLQHSDRNVTADNFFTSVQLAESLLDKNLTLVGTLRQNKPDIPPIIKASKSRE